MKESLIITAPYFNTTGGTEIEAITTAIYLYDLDVYKKITLFYPRSIKSSLFLDLLDNRKIDFLTYPNFFSNKIVNLANRLSIKFGLQYNISDFLFWKYKGLTFNAFYILTYPKSTYFFPLLKALGKQKKCISKITMWHFYDIPKNHLNFYKTFKKIIVFTQEQKNHWDTQYDLNNVVVQDIMIPNEQKLLLLKEAFFLNERPIVFGYFGRISKEKNIEDTIKLLNYLYNKENVPCKLIMYGTGDENYMADLKQMATDYNLLQVISFKFGVLSPAKTHIFYNSIDVFLVTSLHEGGPITALEAAASGRMILSYKVGAMSERFSIFPYIINSSFEDLCASALSFCKLKPEVKNNLTASIKGYYKLHLFNSKKVSELLKVINNE